MNGRIKELSGRMEDRMAVLRTVRGILSDSGEDKVTELLLKSTDSMYLKLSEIEDVLLAEAKRTEN